MATATATMEGIPSIDEVLATHHTPAPKDLSPQNVSADYEVVETLQVPVLAVNASEVPAATEQTSSSSSSSSQKHIRSRSRSLFSFRSSSSSRSSVDSKRSEEDGRPSSSSGSKKSSKSGSSWSSRKKHSNANSISAAAVLPAVLVLGAECFTPGHGSTEEQDVAEVEADRDPK